MPSVLRCGFFRARFPGTRFETEESDAKGLMAAACGGRLDFMILPAGTFAYAERTMGARALAAWVSSRYVDPNRSLIARWVPQYAGLQSRSSPLTTGEVMLAAQKIGARLRGLFRVECLPGPRVGSRFRPRLHGDPNRFIWVDALGRRFVREDGFRNEIRDAVLALPERMAFLIVDNKGFEENDELIQRDSIRGVETGNVFGAESFDVLGGMMGLSQGALEATVSRFNEVVRLGGDVLDDAFVFGRIAGRACAKRD